MSRPIRILFVCVENSCRSQMAEAFARIHGGPRVLAYSAGSAPSGTVNPKAIASMRELGYNLGVHGSKSLSDFSGQAFDIVVTMGCGEACPPFPARRHEAWQIPDPKHLPPDQFNAVRDLIERMVRALLDADVSDAPHSA